MPPPDPMRTVSFRCSTELYDEMRRAAEEQNRSLSNWIETVLKREVERQQEQQE